MKRIVEVILAILGILSYGLVIALGGLMFFLRNNEEFLKEFSSNRADDLETVVKIMSTGGTMFIIASILAIILGIIAIFMIKGNKKRPKGAGTIFIVTAVLVAIITAGIGIIPGIFYFIAGLMCLVRKPPQVTR